MSAFERKPRTKQPSLEIRGRVPSWMLRRLRKEHGGNLVIKDDPGELVDVFETDWFRSIDSGMTPGDSVRIYRENHNLTRAELGAKLGNVPRQNVSAMEKGRRGMSWETIFHGALPAASGFLQLCRCTP